MCSRCSAARSQTELLAVTWTGSPTASPKSLAKLASSRHPEHGQRLAGYVGHPEGGIGLSLTSEHHITRFWVQHWVQLIEGRVAFPVRKRRQIGHLAFLLLWLRTRRSGVRVPRGAPSH